MVVRLGTSGVTTLFQQVLEDTMGAYEVIKTHTLLHTLTGLFIGLGMVMMMCKLLYDEQNQFCPQHNFKFMNFMTCGVQQKSNTDKHMFQLLQHLQSYNKCQQDALFLKFI